MADLVTAARTQLKYAGNQLKAGNDKAAQGHLDKADAFLKRAGEHAASRVAVSDVPQADWTGSADAAVERFLDALEAKQKADGVSVLVRGSFSGHGYTRAENIDLATSIGVLDELGDDFFGALVPGASQ